MVCTYFGSHEYDRISKCDDPDVNEVLQEIRKIYPHWFVEQRTDIQKRLFGKPKTTITFSVYESYQYPHGNFSWPEVRVQTSCWDKRTTLNFLYGLNTGLHLQLQPCENSEKLS